MSPHMKFIPSSDRACYSIPGKYIVESWPWLLRLPVSATRFLFHFISAPRSRPPLIPEYSALIHLPPQKRLQWFRSEPLIRRERDIHLLTSLVADVKKRTDEGTCPPCLAQQALDEKEKIGISEIRAAYTVSSPFGAGIETVSGIVAPRRVVSVNKTDTLPCTWRCRLLGRYSLSSVSLRFSFC